MWVTLYTDASFETRSRAAAWAFWARSELGRVIRSGVCPPYCTNSTHAEAAAILAGIYLALKQWRNEIEGILVRSDAKGALEVFKYGAPEPKDEVLLKFHRKARQILEPQGVKIRIKWVKGHRSRETGVDAWLNAECDKMAKITRKNMPTRKGADCQPAIEASEPMSTTTPKNDAPRRAECHVPPCPATAGKTPKAKSKKKERNANVPAAQPQGNARKRSRRKRRRSPR